MSPTPDIFIPLGPGSGWGDNELRYTLRSIETYGRNYGRIVIVGPRVPLWVRPSDRVVVVKRAEANGHKNARIALKTLWTFEHTDIAEHAVQWNDDYVLSAPTDLSTLVPHFKGALRDSAERHPVANYRAELAATWRYLANRKAPSLHYDLHMPVIFTRSAFTALAPVWEDSARDPHGFVVRSTYFNLVGAPGAVLGRDCKLGGAGGIIGMREKIAGRWVFSYGDGAISAGISRILPEMFPAACSFERSGLVRDPLTQTVVSV